MTSEQFLQGVQKNVERIRAYELGMDGTGGTCDCIGLVIGALRLMGGTWTGTHGSNYAARNEMQSLDEIVSPAVLEAGDMVYKARQPEQSGYALPRTYDDHPDRNDYYHVGVVTSVHPLEITHCTGVSGGIKRDNSLGAWKYRGKLKAVVAGSRTEKTSYRVVGGKLNVRRDPNTSSAVITRLAEGTVVEAQPVPQKADWLFVSGSSFSGYCMARYLQPAEHAVPEQLIALLQQALHIAEQIRDKGAAA